MMTTTTRQTRPTETVLPQHPSRYRHLWPHLGAVAVALVLWVVSLQQIDLADMGTVGLVSVFPPTWWASLAVLVVGLVVATTSRARRLRPAPLYVSGFLLVLYATAPLLEGTTRYPYTYKHIGVTQYIATHHTVDRTIDLYHRWPGFFSLSAWLDAVAGVGNANSYAGWTEFGLFAVWALLVYVLARTVTGNLRAAEIACALFVISNWVGQSYYSPQALAYTLTLGVYILIAQYCLVAPNRLGLWLEGKAAALARGPVRTREPSPLPETRQPSATARNGAAAVALGVHAAVVFTHQLSPYMTLLTLAVIAACGYLRPLWLPAGAALITLLYLLTNIGFVQDNYGVFSGLNVFANASSTLVDPAHLTPGKTFVSYAARLLTFLIWGLGIAGVFRRLRRGHVRQAVLVGLALLAPFLVLLGQSYGGEIRLRVFLFSLPWCGIAISWLFPLPKRGSGYRGTIAFGATSALILGLFVVSNFGLEDVNAVPAAEVQASQWLYDNGTPGSVLMLSAPNFAERIGADYNKFVNLQGEATPNLTDVKALRENPFQPTATSSDIDQVVREMQSFAPRGYLVFSSTQYAYDRSYGVFIPGALARLEQGIAQSPRFQLAYGNSDARIYELRDQAAVGGAPPAASALGQQVPDQKSQTGPVQQSPGSEPGDDRGKKADH